MRTPDKWKIDGGTNKKGDLYIWKDGEYYGGHAIATVHNDVEEGAEDNARLIAAAPDLLEACIRAKKLLDEVASMNIQPFPTSAVQLNRDLITILSSLKKLPSYFSVAESEV